MSVGWIQQPGLDIECGIYSVDERGLLRIQERFSSSWG